MRQIKQIDCSKLVQRATFRENVNFFNLRTVVGKSDIHGGRPTIGVPRVPQIPDVMLEKPGSPTNHRKIFPRRSAASAVIYQ